ncbi:hypothetical protein D5Q48_03195 [Salmonella enterica subsp. enterica serovar Larochelle]|jgi:hypothetical protein|uniref:Uncharacterized protein n=3 Tax=root TaxID=1 RepID=A0A7D4YUS0_9CAUD|nr:hypothetical protein [Escherichia coli]EAB4791145.1 hypothetical protein [Salmonella enterica]EBH2591726.1 hypothetical protein [Salmonella enterica subsp. enterica]EBR0311985.1 hypothetical protein [Salmonella enterica subsp. enterica serovar Virchow]EBR8177441.1 hypothetical protein [Salmonella enterica subsp. enterica serovar Heidelberg]EBU9529899.1 hypothetical protein [Salmonella enterica subsp. enterica serovar Haifa]EBV0422785.1 hypothetical protein [Salmonella enterica subsp. enter
MGVLVNYDGKNGIVLREVEDNETVEVNPQTSERTFIVGPKSALPKPDWKEELAKFRGELGKK